MGGIDYLWALVVAAVVGVGLAAAARGRQGRGRNDEVLRALGFVRVDASEDAGHGKPFGPSAGDLMRARLAGREVLVLRESGERSGEVLRLSVPLATAPLPYEKLARALGRGEVLAALHGLAARAGEDRLEALLTPGLTAGGLRRHIDQVVALALSLEALPLAEGMARWFLELTADTDRAHALQRVIDAFPDAPETLATCKVERDLARDPRAALLARQHLERALPPTIAGRAPTDDI